jgi:hypothetical protein
MKTVKFLFLLIIFGLLGLLIYQNIDYFTAGTSLSLNLKFDQWTVPELPNWAFWGVCLGLGLLITGIKGLITAFRLGREIKRKEARITELTAANRDLQARLDVFIHDPYIRKGLSDTTTLEPTEARPPASEPLHKQPAESGAGTSDSLDQNDSKTSDNIDKNDLETSDNLDKNDSGTLDNLNQNDSESPGPLVQNDPGTPAPDKKPTKE